MKRLTFIFMVLSFPALAEVRLNSDTGVFETFSTESCTYENKPYTIGKYFIEMSGFEPQSESPFGVAVECRRTIVGYEARKSEPIQPHGEKMLYMPSAPIYGKAQWQLLSDHGNTISYQDYLNKRTAAHDKLRRDPHIGVRDAPSITLVRE